MTTESQQQYFDLHITGIGYLSRFRDIGSNGGNRRHQPYFAVAIAALEGPRNDPAYSYFDAKISGVNALTALQQPEVAEAINDDDARVLANFKLGGVAPDIYQVRRGAHAGETRVSLKTRLIQIRWVRIKHKGESEYRLAYQDPGSPDSQGEQGTDGDVADSGRHRTGERRRYSRAA